METIDPAICRKLASTSSTLVFENSKWMTTEEYSKFARERDEKKKQLKKVFCCFNYKETKNKPVDSNLLKFANPHTSQILVNTNFNQRLLNSPHYKIERKMMNKNYNDIRECSQLMYGNFYC